MSIQTWLTLLAVGVFSFYTKAQDTNPTGIKQRELNKVSATYPIAAESTPAMSLKPLIDYPEYWISNLPTTFPKKGENYRQNVKAWITQNTDAWDAMVTEYTAKVQNGTTHKKQVNTLPAQTDENGLRILTKEQFDAFPIERQQFILNNPDRFSVQH
jgi:hypothetical protein